ncbi:MAG: poly-gamma-glutamate hydrolase family protein, partial [Chloroflexota bacterium]|nr:poly-gamma-glutamate hydrolase family protein [Chloroflexota bacterium]
ELARAIAAGTHRLYRFVGKAPAGNGRLHVSSTRFDEPWLRTVLNGARAAISIHGCGSDEEALTLIGGSNRPLAAAIRARLEKAGFAVMEAPAQPAGVDPDNIFNRVPEGAVWLELTRRLREDLRSGRLRKSQLQRYARAIREALAEYDGAIASAFERSPAQTPSSAA